MDDNSYSSAGVSRAPLDNQIAQQLKAAYVGEKPPKIQVNTVITGCLLILMLAMVVAIAALGVTERNRDILQEIATATHMAQVSSAR